jgi:apolipoprotein N-acyltransferase
LALLGHTQEAWIALIQISDLFGAYGVGFVVMLVAACLARAMPASGDHWTWRPLALVTVVLAGVLAYGYWRIEGQPAAADGSRSVRVALIQGSIDTQFDQDTGPDEPTELERSFIEYLRLTDQATSQDQNLDLIMWPETMFTEESPVVTYDPNCRPSPSWDLSPQQFREGLAARRAAFQQKAEWIAGHTRTPMLVGTGALHYQDQSVQRFNSAILIDPAGAVLGRYDKVHRVMFGEYVPLGNWFPWLYRLTPMGNGLTPGGGPVSMEVGPLRMSPSICFENTVPHLIRRQVARLTAQGHPPDILVTLTNDGWFWGSSLLDLHLACGRFRAVEMRRPVLIAANTGFSASIDGSGRIQAKGPRRDRRVVTVRVQPDGRRSVYLMWGDWAAGLCLALCVVSAAVGIGRRFGPWGVGTKRPV